MAERKNVLQDHKRIGRTLLPPFVHMLGGFQEISWTRTVLPQLVWIGCIQKEVGHRRSVELLTALARCARKLTKEDNPLTFAFATDFLELSQEDHIRFCEDLENEKILTELQSSLACLVAHYPQCPFGIFFNEHPPASQEELDEFKRTVATMHDRFDVFTTMVQATATWLAFDSGLLKVAEGLPLADFPEIEKYPNTELSQRVASGVRTTVNMFCAKSTDQTSQQSWENYFWNRGFEIELCEFEDE